MKNREDTIKALKKELDLYKTIVDVAFEGIMATDKDGIITVYNREIAKTEGLNPNEIIGKKEKEIYNFPEYDFPEMIMKRIKQEGGSPIIEQPYLYRSPNGEQHHIIYSAYPYYYNGEFQGIISMGRDVMQINSFINATMALEHQLKAKENKNKEGAYYFLDNIIGSSLQMRKAVSVAEKVATHDIPVMIIGETGTGKELFAQGIHNAGSHRKGPFVSVNCAAIPETLLESILFGTSKGSFTGAIDMKGLFEQAENGSLFLDEINSMPLPLQGKLLRAIQEKRIRRLGDKKEITINCRIISATNQDPFESNNNVPIRSDLLFRLSTAVVNIPPLRERKEDIPELCQYFMRSAKQNKSIFLWDISPDLLKLFFQYDWPGNVRELENIIASSIIFADNQERFLKTNHIPEHLLKNFFKKRAAEENAFVPCALKEVVGDFEKNLITQAILAANGNMSKTAEILQISRQNLYTKIHKYHMESFLKEKI